MPQPMKLEMAAALGLDSFIHASMSRATAVNAFSALANNPAVRQSMSDDTRRDVAGALGRRWLYYEDLKWSRRDRPLVAPGADNPIETLEVFRPDQGKGGKRPLEGGGETSPPKRLAVQNEKGAQKKVEVVEILDDSSETSPPKRLAVQNGKEAQKKVEVVEILDDGGDDDGKQTDDGEEDVETGNDPLGPDYGYEKHKAILFRYHKIDDHPGQWPGPDIPGNRFDTAKFLQDFNWPAKDFRVDFERELMEGGNDLYMSPDSNHDVGLGRDLKERGWQLDNPSGRQLIKGLPLVEDVVFVRHTNNTASRGMTQGICFWAAIATHIYGDARFWLRVKSEHLEHFARVLENPTHPRHELYSRLNSRWSQVKASSKPGSPRPAYGENKAIHMNLWQVLHLPGVYTPMEMLDVTADLYGLYLVVYSYDLPRGPYKGKVYKTIARGAYNARHLGLLFVGGNHFQPIIPNDYIHWEFKFPRITQAGSAAFDRTGRQEGVRHPWRSEYPARESYGGQRAPVIVDHGFDSTLMAMTVGYPMPWPKPSNNADDGDDSNNNDAPDQSQHRKGGIRDSGDNNPDGKGSPDDGHDADDEETPSKAQKGKDDQGKGPDRMDVVADDEDELTANLRYYSQPILDPPPDRMLSAREFDPNPWGFDRKDEEERDAREGDEKPPVKPPARRVSIRQASTQTSPSLAPTRSPFVARESLEGGDDADLAKQVSDLEKENDYLNKQIDELEAVTTNVPKLKEQIADQGKQIADQRLLVKDLLDHNTKLNDENARLSNQNSRAASATSRTASTRQTSTQTSPSPLPAPEPSTAVGVPAARDDMPTLRRRVWELEQQNGGLYEQIDKLKEDHPETAELETEVAKQKDEIAGLEEEKASLLETINALNNQDLEVDKATAEKKAKDTEKKLATTKGELAGTKEQLAEAKIDLATLRRALVEAQKKQIKRDHDDQDRDELVLERDQAIAELDRLRMQIELLQQQEQLRPNAGQPPVQAGQRHPAGPVQQRAPQVHAQPAVEQAAKSVKKSRERTKPALAPSDRETRAQKAAREKREREEAGEGKAAAEAEAAEPSGDAVAPKSAPAAAPAEPVAGKTTKKKKAVADEKADKKSAAGNKDGKKATASITAKTSGKGKKRKTAEPESESESDDEEAAQPQPPPKRQKTGQTKIKIVKKTAAEAAKSAPPVDDKENVRPAASKSAKGKKSKKTPDNGEDEEMEQAEEDKGPPPPKPRTRRKGGAKK
ncbi:hypothetical protein NKR19_g8926 [Coniochaeta hoffmannii]|uniref:Uncharacterized protein n=1 Tax=Coniochaeta hoffmannii TaxID=91930 RepID=A0AA38RCU1_9PEZI|nr:hypothetical protein NKR19_g8926 [Coniochaeta hoffmannii]